MGQEERRVIPVVEEELVVETRRVPAGAVRVEKRVHEREERLEVPLTHESVEVRRVPCRQVVESAPAVRTEGDTTIIPVVTEEVVVTTRLVVTEEIHLTKRRRQEHRAVSATVRHEDVVVQRRDRDGAVLDPA